MRLEGTPQEFAALVRELQDPQIEISDDTIKTVTTRFCGFDPPIRGGDDDITN